MRAIEAIRWVILYAVTTGVVAVIVLMLARFALNYADLNPFSRPVLFVRRMTDPLVNPVRRALIQFGGFGPNIAPLFTILLAILCGWFAMLLVDSILNTITQVLRNAQRLSTQTTALVAIIGWLLYGLLDVYGVLIFIRIIFSWGGVSYSNRVMRFLVNATDPLLVPLRRMIPPLGPFDLSPIVAFILIMLFKAAIAGTLLRFE